MNMKNSGLNGKLNEMARRIHEMRDVVGYSITKMAELTEVSEEEYAAVEAGELDPSFTF